MSRLSLVASLVWLASTLVMPPAHAAQAPITSKAALIRYLHDTPPGASPLDRLSTGGRKRFLASLKFGADGLGGMETDDPSRELTHPQIVRLYALFGVESSARGEGLTPEKQAIIQHERVADARARGCAITTCPESEIEQHYDALVMPREDFSMPDAKRFAMDARHYDQLFASYQSPKQLRAASHPDLRLLERAAEYAVFNSPDSIHIAQLQMDLAEMQRRGMTDDTDFADLYRALISSRQFDQAAALARQHPNMGAGTVPTLRQSTTLPQGWPTALTLDAQDHSMIREAFDPAAPLRIVVVASCHFSQDAARAIEADPQLRSLFAKHAIWLADQNDSIDTAADWNREFPDQPIHIAWHDSEWSMLDDWSMPTFYIFEHGKLATEWSGWPHGSGPLQTLRMHLKQAGVLH